MVPSASLQCPWCDHEAENGDGFRTHLMVQHRKSDLASYVLEGVGNETVDRRRESERLLHP